MTPEAFLAQFGHIADSPNGVQKLRALILDLAVRGKLVPQDANDEPASELLKRIRAEKENHAKLQSRRGRKYKSEPIAEDEVPFDLPEGWVWTKLGDVSNYGMPEKIEPQDVSDETWLLELEDVEKGTSRLIRKVPFGKRKPRSSKNTFSSGNVLYGKLRPYLDKVLVADEEGVCSTEVMPIRPFGHDSYFLRWVLKSSYFLDYASNSTHGMSLPRLGTEKGRKAIVPLPPLPEQKRIVAKVDQLMALCDRLEGQQKQRVEIQGKAAASAFDALVNSTDAEAFAANWQRIVTHFDQLIDSTETLKTLRATILDLAVRGKLVPQNPNDEPASELLKRIRVEKERHAKAQSRRGRKYKSEPIAEDEIPFEIPQGWEWVRLGDYGSWGAGATPNRKNPAYYGGKINWFKSGELNDGHISHSEEKITKLALQECSLRQNKAGDVLIAMYGATIGKVAILDVSGTTNQAVCACTCTSGVYNEFLFLLLKAYKPNFTGQGAGGAQPNISREKIIHTVTPLPPLAEQKRIVAKVDQLMALCDRLEAQLTAREAVGEKLATSFTHHLLAA